MLQTSNVIEIVQGKIFGKVTTLYIRKVRAVSLKIIKQGILRCFLSVQVSTELWKKKNSKELWKHSLGARNYDFTETRSMLYVLNGTLNCSLHGARGNYIGQRSGIWQSRRYLEHWLCCGRDGNWKGTYYVKLVYSMKIKKILRSFSSSIKKYFTSERCKESSLQQNVSTTLMSVTHFADRHSAQTSVATL